MSDGAKTWVFTLNNWTPTELANILAWDVSRMSVAEETGEEGTPHLQGAVTFRRKYRLAALKKMQSRAHWEVAVSADCFNYCHKDDNIVHVIDNRNPGKRTDLEQLYGDLESGLGVRDRDFWAKRPCLQHITIAEKYGSYFDKGRAIMEITVIWIYGPTGSGKSHFCYTNRPDLYTASTHKWWDGYTGQTTVLIDDFRPGWCSWHELLRLTDKYPLRLERKGGHVQALWDTLIFTCPSHYKELYAEVGEDIGQLERRITNVLRFDEAHEIHEEKGHLGFI